jgi:hypothetical protein
VIDMVIIHHGSKQTIKTLECIYMQLIKLPKQHTALQYVDQSTSDLPCSNKSLNHCKRLNLIHLLDFFYYSFYHFDTYHHWWFNKIYTTTQGSIRKRKKFAKPILNNGDNTGHTQKNGAVLIVKPIKTAPIFFLCPVFVCCYFARVHTVTNLLTDSLFTNQLNALHFHFYYLLIIPYICFGLI